MKRTEKAAEEGFLDSYNSDLLAEKVKMLPEMQRDALYLNVVEGMTVEEIADMLCCKSETIKKRLHRARSNLKLVLEKEDE